MSRITIAIDGPAGAGKSTISKEIAKKLNIQYIDTGAMYRALTLKVIRSNIDLKDKNRIINILNKTSIKLMNNHIYLDGDIVDEEIRTNEVSNTVSIIAKIKEVREILVKLQRQLAENSSVIMDGRDIGSHVLPNADYKFYITASVKERGERRYRELLKKGVKTNLEDIIRDIKKRDKIDSTREFAPLVKSPDAIVIDTSNKTVEECVNQILSYIKKGGN